MAKRSKRKKNVRKQIRPTLGSASKNYGLWLALALGLITFLVYLPSLNSDFVYDAHKEIIDEGFITSFSNLPKVISLKVLSMNLMLGDRPGQLLYLMFIAAVAGKTPFSYHLCSNLIHAVNVGLLYVLLCRLIAKTSHSAIKTRFKASEIATATTCLFFAFHPLAVESVAEVSYSSSLLVTLFTLLALLAATYFNPEIRQTTFMMGGLGIVCALAAVTAKESGIALAVLLVAYWYLFRRHDSKGPWIAFILGAGAISISFLVLRFSCANHTQQPTGFLGGTLFQVFLIQPRLWVFMMGKIIWPTHLSADYTPVDLIGPPTFAASVILLVVIALQTWLFFKNPVGALGVAIYWAGLATVSNFVPLYRPLADRFYYLPLAGVAMQILAILLLMIASRREYFWSILTVLWVALIPLLALTIKRQAVFVDDFSLWSDTLQQNPGSAVAHSGLGWSLYQKGQLDYAISQYHQAIEINSNMPEAYNNLGLALYQKGQWDEALAQYQKAQDIDPETAQISNNMGLALAQKGRMGEAVFQYQKALAINPSFAEAHNNLGLVLAQEGRLDDAATQYKQTLEINPNQAETHNNLAIVLAQKGEMNQAIIEFNKALQIKPDYSAAANNLAKAKASLNQNPVGK